MHGLDAVMVAELAMEKRAPARQAAWRQASDWLVESWERTTALCTSTMNYVTTEWIGAKTDFLAAFEAAKEALAQARAHIRAACGQELDVHHVLHGVREEKCQFGVRYSPGEWVDSCAYETSASLSGIWEFRMKIGHYWAVSLKKLRRETEFLRTLTPERWESLWAECEREKE